VSDTIYDTITVKQAVIENTTEQMGMGYLEKHVKGKKI
jgi:hypothetical protein